MVLYLSLNFSSDIDKVLINTGRRIKYCKDKCYRFENSEIKFTSTLLLFSIFLDGYTGNI
jgi:hypothetical protein